MRKYILLISALALIVSSTQTVAQQVPQQRKVPEFEKEIQVNVVLVDVVVTDRNGNYVKGLGDGDFIAFENGEDVEVTSVDEYFLAADETQNAEELAHSLYESPPRNIVIILDRFFSSTYAISRGKDALVDFIDNKVQPGDRVMLLTYDKGFNIIQDLTTDHQMAKIKAMSINTLSKSPDTPEYQTNVSSRSDQEMRFSSMNRDAKSIQHGPIDTMYNIRLQNDVRSYLEQLQSFALSLKALPGRKTVILLSEGYDNRVVNFDIQAAMGENRNTDARVEPNPTTGEFPEVQMPFRDTNSSLYSVFNEMVSEINDATTSFYVIDLTTFAGHRSRSDQFEYQSLSQENDYGRARLDSLYTLADTTGGKLYSGINELGKILDKINNDISNYYIIAYSSPNPKSDGSFRKVAIRTKNDAFTVRTRKGFYAPKKFTNMGASERYVHLMEGFFRTSPENELEGRSEVFFLPINATEVIGAVAVEIPVSSLAGDGEKSLEIIGSVTDQSNRRLDALHKQVDYGQQLDSLRDDEYFTIKLPMLFQAGYNRLRVIIRDNSSGKRYFVFDEYVTYGATDDDLFMSSIAMFEEEPRPSTLEKYNFKESDLSNTSGFKGYRVPDPLRAATGRPFFPRIDLSYSPEDTPVAFFSAGNFWQDEGTGEVDFYIDYNIIDEKGNEIALPVGRERLYPVPGTTRVNVLSQLQLNALTPGNYQLRVRFLDKHRMQGVQRVIPIKVR